MACCKTMSYAFGSGGKQRIFRKTLSYIAITKHGVLHIACGHLMLRLKETGEVTTGVHTFIEGVFECQLRL